MSRATGTLTHQKKRVIPYCAIYTVDSPILGVTFTTILNYLHHSLNFENRKMTLVNFSRDQQRLKCSMLEISTHTDYTKGFSLLTLITSCPTALCVRYRNPIRYPVRSVSLDIKSVEFKKANQQNIFSLFTYLFYIDNLQLDELIVRR